MPERICFQFEVEKDGTTRIYGDQCFKFLAEYLLGDGEIYVENLIRENKFI